MGLCARVGVYGLSVSLTVKVRVCDSKQAFMGLSVSLLSEREFVCLGVGLPV